jgi:enterochelin esterase-like enzyme
VVKQIESLTNNQLAIIIDCGVDDFFLTVNRALHEKLLQLKINHDYIERPGGHSSAYWSGNIDYQILYFKKFFEKK